MILIKKNVPNHQILKAISFDIQMTNKLQMYLVLTTDTHEAILS